MIAQKSETEEPLARPRQKIDQSPEAQLERLGARYVRLAKVGAFDPPSQDAGADELRRY